MPKILLVEEVEFVIDILQKKLEREGYEVTVARDRKEGLMKLKEAWPDLVLIDVDMTQSEDLEIMEEMNRELEEWVKTNLGGDSKDPIYYEKDLSLENVRYREKISQYFRELRSNPKNH